MPPMVLVNAVAPTSTAATAVPAALKTWILPAVPTVGAPEKGIRSVGSGRRFVPPRRGNSGVPLDPVAAGPAGAGRAAGPGLPAGARGSRRAAGAGRAAGANSTVRAGIDRGAAGPADGGAACAGVDAGQAARALGVPA